MVDRIESGLREIICANVPSSWSLMNLKPYLIISPQSTVDYNFINLFLQKYENYNYFIYSSSKFFKVCSTSNYDYWRSEEIEVIIYRVFYKNTLYFILSYYTDKNNSDFYRSILSRCILRIKQIKSN
jgi:hypothetical protein